MKHVEAPEYEDQWNGKEWKSTVISEYTGVD